MTVEDALLKGCDGCEACPFSMTEQAEAAQNLGCLPTPQEILEMARTSGQPWGCHDGSGRTCRGYASVAVNLGLATKGKAIEYAIWYNHGSEAAMQRAATG
jgi:hypothetical protein